MDKILFFTVQDLISVGNITTPEEMYTLLHARVITQLINNNANAIWVDLTWEYDADYFIGHYLIELEKLLGFLQIRFIVTGPNVNGNKRIYGKNIEYYPHGEHFLDTVSQNIILQERRRFTTTTQQTEKNLASDKLFVSLNRNINYGKMHRVHLLDYLTKINCFNQGVISVGNEHKDQTIDVGMFKYYDGGSLYYEPDGPYSQLKIPSAYYNGFIDICTESTYLENAFFMTEKIAKPIAALKPFLVIGPPHYYEHYEQYGLLKYDKLFNYDFDKIINMEERVEAVVDQVLSLRNRFNNPEEKKKMYDACFPQMWENAENFFRRKRQIKHNTPISNIDLKTVKFFCSEHNTSSLFDLLNNHYGLDLTVESGYQMTVI